MGALAGTVNGLLGAGGGIIITYFLSRILTKDQKNENGVFANAVATMLPISIVSLLIYITKGYIKVNASLLTLVPSALIGGILGAFLLTKLHLKTVKIIFSFLVVISGIMMILK
jgi:uncharacterized membrane protein YfcA